MEHIEKRLDQIKKGDEIIDNKGNLRTVWYINPCYNGTWFSMSLAPNQEPNQILGWGHQFVNVPKT